MSRLLTYSCDRCKTTVSVAINEQPQGWSQLQRTRRAPENASFGTTNFDLCPACSVLVDVAIEGLSDDV